LKRAAINIETDAIKNKYELISGLSILLYTLSILFNIVRSNFRKKVELIKNATCKTFPLFVKP
jgi:SPX domain protein involved in polyphosphate accumulation